MTAPAANLTITGPTPRCPADCEDAQTCVFCDEDCCGTHDPEDYTIAECVAREAPAHAICHREACRDRWCWDDPDTAPGGYKSRFEGGA